MSRGTMSKSIAPATFLAVLLAAAPLMAQVPQLPPAPEDLRVQVERGAVNAPRGDLSGIGFCLDRNGFSRMPPSSFGMEESRRSAPTSALLAVWR